MRKVVSLAIALAFSAATFAFAAEKMPESAKIGEASKKQPAVTFPHEKHVKMGTACDTCHHTNKGLKKASDAKVEKCSTCHLDPKEAKVPSMREMSMQKNPFHQVCINCHKKDKKGPATCVGCHKK